MKNWKHIEYVILKDSYKGFFDNTNYSSIEEFVNSNEFRSIRESLTEHPCYTYSIQDTIWDQTHRYNLLDECGLIIPLWKIREAIPKQQQWRHHDSICYQSEYRVDPVPYTGKSRWHFSNYYRNPNTKQERTINNNHIHDEDIIDYNIKIRTKRCGYNLPSSWDDVCRSDIRNKNGWKSNRKTQYKVDNTI